MAKPRNDGHRGGRLARAAVWLLPAMTLLAVAFALYVLYLDGRIRTEFEGKRWALPARVFARPLEIYPGLLLGPTQFVDELDFLHYRSGEEGSGTYRRRGDRFTLHTRGFVFPDGEEKARRLIVDFADGRVAGLRDAVRNEPVPLARLEPALIANIYPAHNEDRLLVRLDDAPPLLVDALVAVEDRRFFEHHGVDPLAVVRALVANLRAGETVQGGSTLTQQLVKNFFLTQERTLARKVNEAIMAVLIELHYDKREILEAYLNEVYLGQEGVRAIHGFGLAAQFYFQRRLEELEPQQIAMLVALVRGATWYNPRARPQRALERRNLVLDLLAQEGKLTADEARNYKSRPLGVSENAPSGVTPFPAFLQLVREQLQRDYREEDLQSEGLFVFTTLSPTVQLAAERAVVSRLSRIESNRRIEDMSLQAAVVVASADDGEVVALVGDRNPRYAGFNRALRAERPIGSLVKPAIYLAALEQPGRYTLATLLDDRELTMRLDNGDEWAPQNYDKTFHDKVLAIDALAKSYNVATARLGLDVGLPTVIRALEKLGVGRPLKRYPSLLLGAFELTPIEVAQMYQTLASGGYRAPLRAIRSVVDRDGKVLTRYPLEIVNVVTPEVSWLIDHALQEVVRSGTGASLSYFLPPHLHVAGKTGTTDDLRDAWFAGYTGEHVAVVWVGRDDNGPTGLSGASGALPVWADTVAAAPTRSLERPQPEAIEWAAVNPVTGLRGDGCPTVRELPFIAGSAPDERSACAPSATDPSREPRQWFRRLFK